MLAGSAISRAERCEERGATDGVGSWIEVLEAEAAREMCERGCEDGEGTMLSV